MLSEYSSVYIGKIKPTTPQKAILFYHIFFIHPSNEPSGTKKKDTPSLFRPDGISFIFSIKPSHIPTRTAVMDQSPARASVSPDTPELLLFLFGSLSFQRPALHPRRETLFRSNTQFLQHFCLPDHISLTLRELRQRILVADRSRFQHLTHFLERIRKAHQFLIQYPSSQSPASSFPDTPVSTGRAPDAAPQSGW